MSRLAKIYIGFWVAFLFFTLIGIDSLRGIAFWGVAILTIYYAVLLTRKLVRKFLWRIRRKLILSYIFIGFIPLFLLTILFSAAFFMFMGQATSEMFNSVLDGYLLQTQGDAKKLLVLSETTDASQLRELWARQVNPEDRPWMQQASIMLYKPGSQTVVAGQENVPMVPWLAERDFTGLVTRAKKLWLLSAVHDRAFGRTLIFQLPVSKELLEPIGRKIGSEITWYPSTEPGARGEWERVVGNTRSGPLWPKWWDVPIAWFSLPDQYLAETGEKFDFKSKNKDLIGDEGEENAGQHRMSGKNGEADESRFAPGAFVFATNVSRVYAHIFSRSTILQQVVYYLMLAIAISFLIIELISFVSGFLLAKSITASVHSLFEGTERITAGDLNYRIKVKARDQLGDLAKSFNSMTESIQNLLLVRAEKERLSESLKIARQMQENLLPKQITSVGGMEIATMNLPAQEVCGDYYDIIRKTDQEVGIIIADVSGKGPSAALYMAEVKGVMLSMSRRLALPRDILVEANRILAPTLDSKNFITMTYATIHEQKRVMRMCRAGHNPILHYCSRTATIEVVQPQGIGLGLSRNGLFESKLEEVERNLCPGDILVFYTDGLTEAMNANSEFYGLKRLSDMVLATKDQPTEQVKTAILDDLRQFLGSAPPQDDVSLVLLKIQ